MKHISGLTCLRYIQFVFSGLFHQQMNAHIQDYVSDKMDKKMKIFFYSAVSKIYFKQYNEQQNFILVIFFLTCIHFSHIELPLIRSILICKLIA